MTVKTKLIVSLAMLAGIALVTFTGNGQPELTKEIQKPVFHFVETAQLNSSVSLALSKRFGQYKVRDGDTKYSIAKNFGLTIDELQFANPQLETDTLLIGEVLNIPSVD
jgi:LysM repeat protein